MASKVLRLFITIGLMHHVKILTAEQTDKQEAINMEQLYRVTFTNESIAEMAVTEYNDTKYSLRSTGLQRMIDGENVTFHLFTRSNPTEAYFLELQNTDNLKESPFNSAWQTKVLIHGWKSSVPESWVEDMTKNYLTVRDYNIIGVDWSPLSVQDYVPSVELTRAVGEKTARLLKYLNTAANISFNDVHVLGHSLGAHVAGYVGKNVDGALSRITGLDPAGPLFEIPEKKAPGLRLDPSDATFVDIVHTCGGVVGFFGALGHVDFYPNGGTCNQPGCTLSLTCSHGRAYDYMLDSIMYPEEFVAVQCGSLRKYKKGKCSKANRAIMGERVNSNLRGVFYLTTNSQSPYGKGHKARHNGGDYGTGPITCIVMSIIISNMYKIYFA